MKLIQTSTIIEVLNISRKSVLERAAREGWQYVKRGKSYLWLRGSLPADVQTALATGVPSVPATTTATTAANTFLLATEAERTRAKLRALIVNAYNASLLNVADFCDAFNTTTDYAALAKTYGKALSPRTLSRWLADYRQSGIAGLTPKSSKANRQVGDALTDEEKNILKYFYLHYNRRSIRHCYLSMLANLPHSRATEITCRRYLNSLPADLVTLTRQGTDKFNDRYLPYIEGNKELYPSLSKVQGDHHKMDILVVRGNRRFRPWLTSFIDYRSGLVAGYCVCVTPSSASIIIAYYNMVVKYGVPGLVHVDNGKDYRGKAIAGHKQVVKATAPDGTTTEETAEILGGIVLCGSKLQYARPYSGRSKGVVERFHRTFGEYFGKNTISYLGSDTVARVDEQRLLYRAMKGYEQRNDIMTFDECVHKVDAFMTMYNESLICSNRDGKSPLQVFTENTPAGGFVKPDMATLELALTRGELKTVKRNGIRIDGTSFWSMELMRLIDHKVIARVSLVNPSEVLICDRSGKFLCKAYSDTFRETGDLAADNERVTSIQKQLRQAVAADGEITLTAKPKTLIELMAEQMEQDATSSLRGSATLSSSLRGSATTEAISQKKLKENLNAKTANKYKTYFDADDLDSADQIACSK